MSTLTVVPNQPDRLTEQVAAEVRAYMARGRINQTQLAEALGLTQSSVSKRLRGVIAFDVNELQQVAEVLGVHPAVLLGGNAPSPSGGSTLRSHHGLTTVRDGNLFVLSGSGDVPGAMRTTRTAAA